jgi:hypothetical protein
MMDENIDKVRRIHPCDGCIHYRRWPFNVNSCASPSRSIKTIVDENQQCDHKITLTTFLDDNKKEIG